MIVKTKILLILLTLSACNSTKFNKTIGFLDINRFMGKWYVIASRASFIEKGAYNTVEKYVWNQENNRIDIDFKFNEDSYEGEIKSIRQKAWIYNKESNAHWKVQPFWPLKFDYLILDIDVEYNWVVIGVPSQKYIWIMGRDWKMTDESLEKILLRIKKLDYSIANVLRVPQRW
jgi:apolipoprotein D and lipocalin family protein